MGRGIVSQKDLAYLATVRSQVAAGGALVLGAAKAELTEPDDYKSRLLKYIPAEVIGFYITAQSIVSSAGNPGPWLLWGVFLFGLIVTPLYLRRFMKVTKTLQLVINTGAFVVWVFALGGPFELAAWYQPVYGALLLPAYTLIIPLVES